MFKIKERRLLKNWEQIVTILNNDKCARLERRVLVLFIFGICFLCVTCNEHDTYDVLDMNLVCPTPKVKSTMQNKQNANFITNIFHTTLQLKARICLCTVLGKFKYTFSME